MCNTSYSCSYTITTCTMSYDSVDEFWLSSCNQWYNIMAIIVPGTASGRIRYRLTIQCHVILSGATDDCPCNGYYYGMHAQISM